MGHMADVRLVLETAGPHILPFSIEATAFNYLLEYEEGLWFNNAREADRLFSLCIALMHDVIKRHPKEEKSR